MDEILLYGYTLDEIGESAAELFHTIAELQIPTKLALLALCKTVVMVGDEADMDEACVMIDKLRELAEDEEYVEEDEEDGEDEDSDF